jgi:hypothetical protein
MNLRWRQRSRRESCAGEAEPFEAQGTQAVRQRRGDFGGHGCASFVRVKRCDLQGRRAGPANSIGTRTARKMPSLQGKRQRRKERGRDRHQALKSVLRGTCGTGPSVFRVNRNACATGRRLLRLESGMCLTEGARHAVPGERAWHCRAICRD